MGKNNEDFFVEKKPWSEVKDELLKCYFKPYVAKILHTHKPLVYVDCFAGKGKFEDGKPGSPIIALDTINECLATKKTMGKSKISAYFIDSNYANELNFNLRNYQLANVISGRYEDTIKSILNDKNDSNVFLYIDPFGIKDLHFSLFDNLSGERFNSIELLINLNSFGFIREACRAMKTSLSLDDSSIFDDLTEYDSAKIPSSQESLSDLSEIAGGTYWTKIIEAYKANNINGYEAEEVFAKQYCERLSNNFQYVLNMPLRIKRGQRPKYRMIHATNHPEGCLLMVDNICNRWETWESVQDCGQMRLFHENPTNQIVNEDDIELKFISHFSQFESWTHINESIALFFMEYGVICKTAYIRNLLKKYENNKRILIKRNPPTTMNGSPSRFMSESSSKKVLLRWLI